MTSASARAGAASAIPARSPRAARESAFRERPGIAAPSEFRLDVFRALAIPEMAAAILAADGEDAGHAVEGKVVEVGPGDGVLVDLRPDGVRLVLIGAQAPGHRAGAVIDIDAVLPDGLRIGAVEVHGLRRRRARRQGEKERSEQRAHHITFPWTRWQFMIGTKLWLSMFCASITPVRRSRRQELPVF